MSPDRSRFQGTIEYSDHEVIKGWAVDTEAPASQVSLQVLQHDRVIDVIRPSLFRWDLRLDGIGDGCHGFVFPIPGQLRSNGGEPLHVRFSATGLELENSPVKLPVADESRLAPFQTTDLTGRRVLVLAPHPDDESLACGGAVILHTDHGDPVKVVFLTDGARAQTANSSLSQAEYVGLRKREAEAAARMLGVVDLEFWEAPDRQLGSTLGVLDRLKELLQRYRPDLIYAPSPLEFHPDHRAAAELVWTAVAESELKTEVAFYDFNRPVNVNTLVDISAVLERKRRACELYDSQLENYPYADAAQALNRYRALTVASTADHAEGFFLMSSHEMTARPVDSFVLRQFLPQGIGAVRARPLVSVIVRTKNRPELLRDALSSIATQTYPNIEVVIVNDGGCDVSRVADEFSPYLRIDYTYLERSRGRAAAANEGLRRASGEYLNFLDDDDVFYPNHLEKLAGYLETTGERMAYSDCEKCSYEWGDDRFRPKGDKSLFMGYEHDQDRLYWGNYIPFMTAMVRRDLAEEVGPFDESLEALEDWDYWIRASKIAPFFRLPGITSQYRVFADHRYDRLIRVIYEKHSDYWNIDNLTRSAWPRIDELKEELLSANARIDELEQRLASTAAEREQFRRQFEMVTQSYSWRLTRLAPQGLRTLLKRSLKYLTGERAEKAAVHRPPTDSAPEPKPRFVVRAYEPGDENQILELFGQCFGHRRSLEQWLWKYRDNPYGARNISLVFSGTGELAAHYAAFPIRLWDSTEDRRRSILAFQIGDTMTAPAVRNVGRRSTLLLTRAMRHHFETFCEGRVGFNYGFNTGKIQRYYVRLVPGSRFFEPVPLRVLEPEGLAAQADDRGASYRVETVDRLDDEWDEFFHRVAPDYGFLTERDATYLRWRYLGSPETEYLLYRVSLDGRLVGWGVFKESTDCLIWGDSLFDREHAGAAAEMLAVARERAPTNRARRIEAWFGANPKWWDAQIATLGFKPVPEAQGLGMIYKPFLEPDPMEKLRSHLYYTMGDSDLF